MTSENIVQVTIKMKGTDTKVINSEKIVPNNISNLVSHLKLLKEEVNKYLTELITNEEKESINDEDDFEDDESDDGESLVENKPQAQNRIPLNNQSPSKKPKH